MSSEVIITRTINAPRQRVFDAWLDPKALVQFIRPGSNVTVPKAETNPTVGGAFLILMKVGEKELPHQGEYTLINKYTTLAFTWLSAHAGEGSLVTLTFSEPAANVTELTLVHKGLVEAEVASHNGGWTSILDTLDRFLTA